MQPVRYRGWTDEEIALAERLGAEAKQNIVNAMLQGTNIVPAFRNEADRTLVAWQIYPRKIRDEADRIGFSEPAVEEALAEADRTSRVRPVSMVRRFFSIFS